MYRKHIITAVILIALIVVVYLAMTEKRIHPPREQWIKEHKVTVERNGSPEKFCYDCHQKRFGQTKENFCNDCHKKSNVPLMK